MRIKGVVGCKEKDKWYKEKIMVIKASSREEALAIETGINGRYSDMSKNILNLFD